MYMRVVRFTGVSHERVDQLVSRIGANDGPPPGVNSPRLQVLFDEADGTAVVLQHFATADDMEVAAKVLSAMDPGETPGTRASVDACEVRLDLES